jgi:hypothetical protein
MGGKDKKTRQNPETSGTTAPEPLGTIQEPWGTTLQPLSEPPEPPGTGKRLGTCTGSRTESLSGHIWAKTPQLTRFISG